MRVRGLLLVPLTLACASAGTTGFDGVLEGLASRYDVHPSGPPLFVSAALALAAPAGASEFRLALFEQPRFGDARELATLVRQRAGAGFRPIVETVSRKKGETTMIYARPAPDQRIAILIFTRARTEATLLQMVIAPDQLADTIKKGDFWPH